MPRPLWHGAFDLSPALTEEQERAINTLHENDTAIPDLPTTWTGWQVGGKGAFTDAWLSVDDDTEKFHGEDALKWLQYLLDTYFTPWGVEVSDYVWFEDDYDQGQEGMGAIRVDQYSGGVPVTEDSRCATCFHPVSVTNHCESGCTYQQVAVYAKNFRLLCVWPDGSEQEVYVE